MSTEQLVSSRVIDSEPGRVFAVLCDPNRHQDIDLSEWDWVRDAIDTEPITRQGQIFGVNMFIKEAGPYVMHNRVTVFEPDRAIAWEPGQLDAAGDLGVGGWVWRYDLLARDGATEVSLTYDWSATPERVREEIGGLPPFGVDYLEDSLAGLDAAVRATRAG